MPPTMYTTTMFPSTSPETSTVEYSKEDMIESSTISQETNVPNQSIAAAVSRTAMKSLASNGFNEENLFASNGKTDLGRQALTEQTLNCTKVCYRISLGNNKESFFDV